MKPYKDGMVLLMQGDCLELMSVIADGSVDAVICDLPYGVTQNKWDCRLDVQALWNEYQRVIRDNGAIMSTSRETPPVWDTIRP